MIKLTIAGWGHLVINNLVLDYNGTIATDGQLLPEITNKIKELSKLVNIYVITADTNGSVVAQCEHLPVSVHIVSKTNQQLEKRDFVEELRADGVVSIGNGNIDIEMFKRSNLAIAVIGVEGCTTKALLQSDIVVNNISDALDLLLKENRLIATLRQ